MKLYQDGTSDPTEEDSNAILNSLNEIKTLADLNSAGTKLAVGYSDDADVNPIVRELMAGGSGKKIAYFRDSKKCKAVIEIDTTPLNMTQCLTPGSGRKFEDSYLEMLEKHLHGADNGDVNINFYIMLARILDIQKQHGPIRVTSKKYFRMIPRAVIVLNKFMNSNDIVIKSIVKMIKDNVSKELEKKE